MQFALGWNVNGTCASMQNVRLCPKGVFFVQKHLCLHSAVRPNTKSGTEFRDTCCSTSLSRNKLFSA